MLRPVSAFHNELTSFIRPMAFRWPLHSGRPISVYIRLWFPASACLEYSPERSCSKGPLSLHKLHHTVWLWRQHCHQFHKGREHVYTAQQIFEACCRPDC